MTGKIGPGGKEAWNPALIVALLFLAEVLRFG